MSSPKPTIYELQELLPDFPQIRVACWHLEGLKQKGMAPELWLTERERAELETLHHERRRCEWTAARIALKRLLLLDEMVRSPLHAEIRKDQRGQPRVVIYEPDTGRYSELACSLAHKNTLVVAAYGVDGAAVGVDIERRSWRLTYLSNRYVAPGDSLLTGGDQIARCTVLWAFKEAMSKLLGQGYAAGFTKIACRETRYGYCELMAPDGTSFRGRYVWLGRYALTAVSNMDTAETPDQTAAAPARPWYRQLTRARKLRQRRRERAVAESLKNGSVLQAEPGASTAEGDATMEMPEEVPQEPSDRKEAAQRSDDTVMDSDDSGEYWGI